MSKDDSIRIEGNVVEVVSDRLVRLELPNGHRILAHIPVRLLPLKEELKGGVQVRVEMSPFDMSRGKVEEIRSGT